MLLVDVPPRACFVSLSSSAARLAVFACGGEGFDPASKVDSVRLFGVKADKPYAKPGETVTLEALFTDARKDKPRAAKLYWIPVLCLNPKDDLYYLCFAPPGDGGRQAGNTRLVPVGPLADAGAVGRRGRRRRAAPSAEAIRSRAFRRASTSGRSCRRDRRSRSAFRTTP